ncbi:MAG: ADP-ribosylglycohydrolase family protein [Bacteroidetes bacterium]|nr:ADP-ribosylglycohydrolase family protein [Bacteroidota bacterium]
MENYSIIGAIAGDIIGSVYEFNNRKSKDIPLFTSESTYTDDTVLTIAVADCIINGKDFSKTIHAYGRKYARRGYGGNFFNWLMNNNPQPYNSYGNGSAMRVSPVGFAYSSIEKVMEEAKKSAEITHNHPEGIKGAQAIASAIFLATTNSTKIEIKDFISETFNYEMNFSIDEIRPFYRFDETCQGSVPQAINCFLESKNYEDAIRLAISIGGDSDTIACMAGGIAAAYYKFIPDEIINECYNRLPAEFLEIINQFNVLDIKVL